MPLARKKGLEVQELADEVLIYDLDRHRAHCLNKPAALVWRQCDGVTTLADTARIVQRELDIPADPEVIVYILGGLRKAHLLEKPYGPVVPARQPSRRDFVKKLNKLGIAAAMMLPLASSIIAPTPAFAASCVPAGACGPAPNCTPCNAPNCNGLCCGPWCLPPFWAAIFCGC